MSSKFLSPVAFSRLRSRTFRTRCLKGGQYCSRSSSSVAETRPRVIFSGIQPTGIPHLGNYLGALRQWVQLQESSAPDTTLLYCLVDLHAITVEQNPVQLQRWKRESLAMLLAIGLDPKRSIIFNQSDVPAHSELLWILSCQASTGYLSRMTQWKDKTANEKDNNPKAKLGLFSYPVLMAADVLLYQTTHVPVGHDQAQHLEFARELATGFNHLVNKAVLHPPETMISPAKRIMSLKDPTMKMSKSARNEGSRILLTDSKDDIHGKIRGAVTDDLGDISYDPDLRPGVSNLIDILFHISDGKYLDRESIVQEFEGVSMKAFKTAVADALEASIRPIRERYHEIMGDKTQLIDVAVKGAEKARQKAREMRQRVRFALGLNSWY